jgi:hypothetical protein
MARTDVLRDELPALRPDQQHAVIRESFKFIRTPAIDSQPTCPLFKYKCDGPRCNLGPVVDQMLLCAELQAWQAERGCADIVADIAHHQSYYLPHKLRAISISRMGVEVARVQIDGVPQSAVIGSIEYNDVRARVRRETDRGVARRWFGWTDPLVDSAKRAVGL